MNKRILFALATGVSILAIGLLAGCGDKAAETPADSTASPAAGGAMASPAAGGAAASPAAGAMASPAPGGAMASPAAAPPGPK